MLYSGVYGALGSVCGVFGLCFGLCLGGVWVVFLVCPNYFYLSVSQLIACAVIPGGGLRARGVSKQWGDLASGGAMGSDAITACLGSVVFVLGQLSDVRGAAPRCVVASPSRQTVGTRRNDSVFGVNTGVVGRGRRGWWGV